MSCFYCEFTSWQLLFAIKRRIRLKSIKLRPLTEWKVAGGCRSWLRWCKSLSVSMSQLLDSPDMLLIWINLVKPHLIKWKVWCSLATRPWAASRHLKRECTVNFQIDALMGPLILNCVDKFIGVWWNVKRSAIEKQVLHVFEEKHTLVTFFFFFLITEKSKMWLFL